MAKSDNPCREIWPTIPANDHWRAIAAAEARMPGWFRRKSRPDISPLEEMEQSLIRFGNSGTPEPSAALTSRYVRLVREASREQRQGMMVRICEAVEHGATTVRALDLIIALDPDYGIVSSAVIDYIGLSTAPDAAEAARDLLFLAESSDDQDQRAAIIGGIVAHGEDLITSLLDGKWSLLDLRHQEELVQRWNGNPWAGTIEFYLRWLEALPNEDAPFATLAACLARIPRNARQPHVSSIIRFFDPDSGATALVPTQSWSVAEYGAVIAPRLAALEARELPPKLIPAVMQAWGVDLPEPADELRSYLEAASATLDPSTHLCRPVGDCDALDRGPRSQDLFNWVYFNPNGPTHGTLTLVPVPGTQSVLLAWLTAHPFAPQSVVLGVVDETDAVRSGLAAAERHCLGAEEGIRLFASLPTHVYLPEGSPVSLADARRILASAALHPRQDLDAASDAMEADWADPWERTRKQMLDMWSQPEVVELLGEINELDREIAERSAGTNGQPGDQRVPAEPPGRDGAPQPEMAESQAPPSLESFERWWSLITDEEHVLEEQLEFLAAWFGAIEEQARARGGNVHAHEPPHRALVMVRRARERAAGASTGEAG